MRLAAVRLAITKALAADPVLAAEVRSMLAVRRVCPSRSVRAGTRTRRGGTRRSSTTGVPASEHDG